MDDIRRRTRLALSSLGCEGIDQLPALDPVDAVRPLDDVRGRCLALFSAVAVAFGLDRSLASTWLASHELQPWLTSEEREFIEDGIGDTWRFRGLIESLWALAWVIGVVPALDWESLCADDFIQSFPDPQAGGLSSPVASAMNLRSSRELSRALDEAYVLHHCHTEAILSGTPGPGGVPSSAVVARRHALEWAGSALPWDEIEMDT